MAALFALPTGQYVILPGVTGNLNRIVHVAGAKPPKKGRILMVAVSVAPANWYQVLTARYNPGEELLASSSLMPPGMDFNQYVKLSMLQMQQSHDDAKAAAFRALGMTVRTLRADVYVGGVVANGPAAGRLEVMDRITEVNGTKVRTAAQVVSLVRAVKAGSVVHLVIVRGTRTQAVAIRSGHSPVDAASAFLGVELMQVSPYQFPRRVKIDTSNIGGPSAGMMFSLAIIAQLHPKPAFPGGRVIAGTGEITPTGQVEPIGGVAEKVITAYRSGATLFLCPTLNYPHALKVKQALHIPIRIVPVQTLSQALAAVGYGASSRSALAG